MPINETLEKLVRQPNALLILEEVMTFFEREKQERKAFHEALHDDFNVEFINGKIIYQPLVAWEHLTVSTKISSSLHGYVKENKLGKVGIEKVMIHLTRNDYQPSICYFERKKADTFYSGQLLFPAPDFIVEIISATTESIARIIKMQDYAAHRVMEYWIINPVQQTVEQYLLEDDHYILHVKFIKEGPIYAEAIKGYSVNLKDVF